MSDAAITKEEFKEKMQYLKEHYEYDEEERHVLMDTLMCVVLTSLGYEEGVKIFLETPMWYA